MVIHGARDETVEEKNSEQGYFILLYRTLACLLASWQYCSKEYHCHKLHAIQRGLYHSYFWKT